MATSKTLTPTNVTIQIPEFTDQPDQRVNSNCLDKEADAINALNSKIAQYVESSGQNKRISSVSLNSITEAGRYYIQSSCTDKPGTGGGYLDVYVYASNMLKQVFYSDTADNAPWVRTNFVNSWSAWQQLTTTDHFKQFSFSGTPDNDGCIITNCPLSNYVPYQAYTVSREGWVINFVQNNNKSVTYWVAKINGATASSGTFSANILAMLKSGITT